MNRMAFLIDGFNLYHSLVDARRAGVLKPTRWLDLRALCEWVMPQDEPQEDRVSEVAVRGSVSALRWDSGSNAARLVAM